MGNTVSIFLLNFHGIRIEWIQEFSGRVIVSTVSEMGSTDFDSVKSVKYNSAVYTETERGIHKHKRADWEQSTLVD